MELASVLTRAFCFIYVDFQGRDTVRYKSRQLWAARPSCDSWQGQDAFSKM